MRAAVASLGTLSLCLLSCGGAAPAPRPEPASQAESVPAPPPDAPGVPDASPPPEEGAGQSPPQAAGTEPSGADSLLELVRGNVATTDLSAAVEITGARVEGPNGGPAPTAGYVNHVYEVDIVTPIRGCGKKERFAFAQMAEADIRPMEIGTALVVSVCRGADGRYFTPDVGYAIPRADLPDGAVEKLAAVPPTKAKAGSACGE